jgi:receptor protein-tyrosine kinase
VTTAPGSSGVVPAQQLSRYLQALRRRSWIVAAVVVIAAGAAFAVSLTTQKKYDATAKVLVTNSDPANAILAFQPTQSNDPERDMNTDVALVTLEPVADRAQRRLDTTLSTSTLLGEIRAGTAGTTNVISITARDRLPARAQAIANAFATSYVAFRRDVAQAQYQQAAARAARQLAAMTPPQRSSPKGKALASGLQSLQAASKLATGGVEVAELAKRPTSPATPRTKLTLAVAVVIGLFLGALCAIGLEFADRRIKDEKDVEELLGLPVLAGVPAKRGWRRPQDDGAAQEEAYATVAVNLRLRNLGTATQTVMVTSAEAEAGKTAATIGVARALARAGQRVIAIEGDLRRPKFASYLGLGANGGLAAVLGSLSSFGGELVSVRATGRPDRDGDGPDAVELLPAGAAVADPHSVLASASMREVLDEARESADVVLIDTPALDIVSDAVDLARGIDTCIFVVRLSHSTKQGVQRALRTLTELGLDVVVIVTGRSARRAYGSDYFPRPAEEGSRVKGSPV